MTVGFFVCFFFSRVDVGIGGRGGGLCRCENELYRGCSVPFAVAQMLMVVVRLLGERE